MAIGTYKAAAKKCKKCRFGELDSDGFCNKGCDYRAAKEHEKKAAEKRCGVQYDKPFVAFDGLSLTATSYEAPYVMLELKGERLPLEESQIRVLLNGLQTGLKWCQEGYAEGSC